MISSRSVVLGGVLTCDGTGKFRNAAGVVIDTAYCADSADGKHLSCHRNQSLEGSS